MEVRAHEEIQPIDRRSAQQTFAPLNPQTLPHRESHKRLGIVHICFGSFIMILSIIGFYVGFGRGKNHDKIVPIYIGGGVYTGIIYIIAGVLGLLAYRNDSRYLTLACMAVNIIAACLTAAVMVFFAFQFTLLVHAPFFQKIKCIILVVCCFTEFVATIVHAGFSCASFSVGGQPRIEIAAPSGQPLPNVTIIPGLHYQLPRQESKIVEKFGAAQQSIHGNQRQHLIDKPRTLYRTCDDDVSSPTAPLHAHTGDSPPTF